MVEGVNVREGGETGDEDEATEEEEEEEGDEDKRDWCDTGLFGASFVYVLDARQRLSFWG